jgi:DNA-binding transcriptional LysR family regulator
MPTGTSPDGPARAAGPDPLEAGSHRWPGVEFRHLGALAAVARHGSFRRAADSLGYVQSAISAQMAQLEQAVGTRLVDRCVGREGASLTPAGNVLLDHVGDILARFEAARLDVEAVAQGRTEILRIGVADGIARRRLPGILRGFAAEIPSAQVSIAEAHGEESFEQLARGEFDMLIAEAPLPEGPFREVLLERDPYVLLVAAESMLAKQTEPVTLGQLSRLSLLLPAPLRGQDVVGEKLREAGIGWAPWLRSSDVGALQALVGAGLGAAFVPSLAVDPDDAATKIVALPELLPERVIVLATHREREYSAPVHEFIQMVSRTFCEARARAA